MSKSHYLDEVNGTLLESIDLAAGMFSSVKTRSLDSVNPFTDIGLGKPMTIKLVTIYAGDYKNGLFKSKKDMIVTSRIRPPHIAEEAPRAVHQIYANMPEKAAVTPSAGNYGTPLIYCTPSFVDEGMMINLEFKIDNFEQDQMEAVGKVLSTLGAIPIFAGASGILTAGGALVQKAAPLVNSLSEKKTWLKFDFDAAIKEAGRKTLDANFHLIRNQTDNAEFVDYEIALNNNNQPELRKKGTVDKFYTGSRPYAIISINGVINDEHVGFSPALASTMILQKFYGIRESGSFEGDVKELVNISNDFYYNKKIAGLKGKLKGLEKTSDEYKQLSEKIEAYKKNLQTDIFKGKK